MDIPIKNPKTIERIVFGPFASYESAKKQAEKLKDKGFETTVAYPKNCFKPIKNFPFLISLLSSTFSNSSPLTFEVNLMFIKKREIHPKNKYKKANLSFIS